MKVAFFVLYAVTTRTKLNEPEIIRTLLRRK